MNKLKKVLFYSDCILFGGSENVIVNLINNYDLQRSYEIYFAFWANRIYIDGMNNKFKSNINLIPLRILSNSYIVILGLKSKKNFMEILIECTIKVLQKLEIFNIYNLFRLYLLLIKIKPSIVYINNGGYPGAESCRIAVFSAKLAGIKKVIFNINNLANEQTGLVDRLKDRLLIKYVHIFITASFAAKKQLAERRKFNLDKIINIANTIPEDFENAVEKGLMRKEFNIDKDAIIIGSAGLLTKRKGYNILIDAIKIVKNEHYNDINFRVFIFGEGEERKNLEDQIFKNNLQQYIFMAGYRVNIKDMMNDFDIFVLPSVAQEDFPYAILEAMALGKPVIGTKIAGIPEQIEDGYNGYIVEPQNSIQMAEAISNLIADNNKILQMGQNSRNRFNELYKYPIVIEQYISLFKKIIGDN